MTANLDLGENYQLDEDSNGNLVIIDNTTGTTVLQHTAGGSWDIAAGLGANLDANTNDITNVGAFDSDSVSTDNVSISNTVGYAYLSSNQAVSPITKTKVNLDSTEIDEFGGFDPTNHKYVIQEDGSYTIFAIAQWQEDTGWSTGDKATVILKINGVVQMDPSSRKIGTGFQGVPAGLWVGRLTAGDELTRTVGVIHVVVRRHD